MQVLTSGTTYGELKRIARRHGIKGLQLNDLLGYLNKIGGLHRKRSIKMLPAAFLMIVRDLWLAIRHQQLSWRRPATPATIYVGLLRACVLLIAATIFVAIFIEGSGLFPNNRVITLSAFGISLFMATLWLHESMHIFIIHRYGSAADVLQRGMRIGILHAPLIRKAECISAISGPLAGFLLGAGAAVAAWFFDQPQLSLVALLVATFHCTSILPWYGDGATLLKSRGRDHAPARS